MFLFYWKFSNEFEKKFLSRRNKKESKEYFMTFVPHQKRET